MDRYTLLYLQWITNKHLLYSIAQETLLNVVRQPGWEGSLGESGYTCIYMAESLRCSPETITTLFSQLYSNIKVCFCF